MLWKCSCGSYEASSFTESDSGLSISCRMCNASMRLVPVVEVGPKPPEPSDVERAAEAFCVDYLSDEDLDVAERDTWIALCSALERSGVDVFALAGERAEVKRESGMGGEGV